MLASPGVFAHIVALEVPAVSTWLAMAILAASACTAVQEILVALISIELAPLVVSAHIVVVKFLAVPAVSTYPTVVEALEVVSARFVVAQIAQWTTVTASLVELAQAAVAALLDGPIVVKSAFVAKSFSEVCYPSAISYIRLFGVITKSQRVQSVY